ncbi:TlpA family protein disulfide reductase [Streptomyces chattanoogensis]|uniref:Redoxin domain-containing protein n=1 Tax=Streptomyces chattanoogensis TaxID=66876 RepID=A0A0N1JXL3_9ACTN|nr:TlpA disulfide reductase family protein [Streptomyces chattanoogensis]KPC62083.1 redoxin domain-containing protein [Streptomyces chattanoogensis]
MSACRPRRTGRRRIALFAAGAAAASLTLSACGDGASGGSAQTKFVQGKGGVATVPEGDRQPAPELSARTTTGTNKLNIADYKGKVVVLNVWGSYCGPCIAEAPNFAAVAQETKTKGVQFVGINTRDEKAQAVNFEEQHKVPYPSLFDPTGKLLLRFPKGSLNPQAIPSTIAIDRHGRIAARSLGPLDKSGLRKMIAPLIAEK